MAAKRLRTKSVPASVARRFAACLMFWPATTSSAICIPVLGALLPRAIAPRWMSGATLRSKPPKKTTQPISSLYSSTDKVGQCSPHLSGVVVVVVHSSKESVLAESEMKRHRHLSPIEWY